MTSRSDAEGAAARLHVIIIGGGIGGLCLAQGLKRTGISFAVYERDRTADARLQGYRLNLEPFGAVALHACLPPNLWSLLTAAAGDAAERMGVYDECLRQLMLEDPRPHARSPLEHTYALSRVALRRVLLTGLDPHLHFDKEFVRYEQSANGHVTAHFADGSLATGNVLIGADGVHSRVRRQLLPDARQIETGGIGVGGKLPLGPAAEAWLPRGLLAGKSMILPPRDFLFTAIFRDEYLMWAFVAHRATFPEGVDELRGRALRDVIEPRMSGWHPALCRLVTDSDVDTIELFRLNAAARVPRWTSTTVTLLGDAIHAMPPVGGLGGNVALCDARALRDALETASRGEVPLVRALAAYEAEMLPRGFAAVAQARRYLQLAISRSRLLRMLARGFFRLCGAVPALRRAIFEEPPAADTAKQT